MPKQESSLSLEIVWKDEHMIEIEVVACNQLFSGTTQVYDTSNSLADFATRLAKQPGQNESIVYTAGETDGYAHLSLKFYPIGASGLIGVYVQLEENTATEYRPEEKAKLALELIVEPNAIDAFRLHLKNMAQLQVGKAILRGRQQCPVRSC